jgi:hypothetical protein
MHQVNNKSPAISIKNQAYMNGDDVSQNEVNQISQCVHGFGVFLIQR